MGEGERGDREGDGGGRGGWEGLAALSGDVTARYHPDINMIRTTTSPASPPLPPQPIGSQESRGLRQSLHTTKPIIKHKCTCLYDIMILCVWGGGGEEGGGALPSPPPCGSSVYNIYNKKACQPADEQVNLIFE